MENLEKDLQTLEELGYLDWKEDIGIWNHHLDIAPEIQELQENVTLSTLHTEGQDTQARTRLLRYGLKFVSLFVWDYMDLVVLSA